LAYIGRPASTTVAAVAATDTFTGNGATQFQLSRAVADGNASAIEVFVSNVQQQPTITYTIAGDVITFTEAPGSGEPIYVIFRDYATAPVFTVPDNSVVAAKIKTNAVVASKIQDGAVTGGKIAVDAVTVTKIQNGAVSSDKLDTDSVTTTKILAGAVTTAKIADTSVTSPLLSSNLTLVGQTSYTGGAIERANIVSSGVSANINVNTQDGAVVYFSGNTASNLAVTVNFTGLSSIAVGNIIPASIILTNNATFNAYISAAQVDNAPANVLRWTTAPTSGSANVEVYGFSIIKTATATYTVLGNKTNYS